MLRAASVISRESQYRQRGGNQLSPDHPEGRCCFRIAAIGTAEATILFGDDGNAGRGCLSVAIEFGGDELFNQGCGERM